MGKNAPDKNGRSSEPHIYTKHMHLMMDFSDVPD